MNATPGRRHNMSLKLTNPFEQHFENEADMTRQLGTYVIRLKCVAARRGSEPA